MKKVLCATPKYEINCPEGLKLLEDNGFQVDLMKTDRYYQFEDLDGRVQDYCAVISSLDCWDDRLFAQAPNLRILAKSGVGVDSVDLEAAKKRNICITNAKGLNAVSVADTAIMLMLAALKNLTHFDSTTKQGQWVRVTTRDLSGKTVGIIGFGEVSHYVIRRLKGFEVNVIAYDPFPNQEMARELDVQLMSFDEVLSQADVISVHVPLLKETHHLMNEIAFLKMKPTAIFVNTSRGKVVDEKALYQALKEGRISGAALDVFEEEPTDPCNPLFSLPNFVCMPHQAAATKESEKRVCYMAAKNIVAFFAGEELERVVVPAQRGE